MPLDTLTRSARANSYDPETRQFEAVIATENPVPRRDARGPYLEILPMSAFDADASTNLPVLDSHSTKSVRDAVGRTLSIERSKTNAVLVAQIVLSSAEDVTPIGARIADGTVCGVSIGYVGTGWIERQTPQGRVRSPARWWLTEVTLTTNPADPAASIRAKETEMPDVIIETPPTNPTPEALKQPLRSEIRTLTRSLGLSGEVADDLIDSGADLTRAKAEIFDHLQTRQRATPIIRSHAQENDDPSVVRTRMADAVAVRMGVGEAKDEHREYLNMSLIDLAKDSLTRSGETTRGMSPDEALTRAATHTTSDFPLVVSNAANKVALSSYEAARSPLIRLSRQRLLSDFKKSTSIRPGEMGRLEELAENSEIAATSSGENGETMQLATYARRFDLARNLIINDDLGMFGDVTGALGEAAAQTEADLLFATFTGNPNLSDGTPVFDASRGNTGDGSSFNGSFDGSDLDGARKAMRNFKGLDGKTLINITPKFLIVGPEIESDAERLLAEIWPATTDDAQSGMSKLTLLVEPRITDTSWYVAADPARLACLQHGYLSSAQGVQIQRQESWNTLGLSFRAFLDFGCGWQDWRGAYFQPAEAS